MSKTVTFMLPRIGPPNSGGIRTVLRMINYLNNSGYDINIELFKGNKPLTDITDQYKKISGYSEINDLHTIKLEPGDQHTSADLYVATGWQTFEKAKKYIGTGKLVVFFCQDIEWKFPTIAKSSSLVNHTKNFYNLNIPTFTMSQYLSKFLAPSKSTISSTTLNVDTSIYYNQQHSRNGICLLYCKNKPHRLPSLILSLAKSLATHYPDKPVILYGSPKTQCINHKNIQYRGVLPAEKTAELYNQCELGVVFSTTNPSRIAYEMVACGTPAIEAKCEYTEHDMDSDAFVRLETDHDVIMNKIEKILHSTTELSRLRTECSTYSNDNFYAYAEEQKFLKFVEMSINSI